MKEWKKFLYVLAAFLACFYLPVENLRFTNAIFEALALVKWYAREHVLLCLVPAFFIAGAISVFVSQASVMKYFGAKANKFLSYSVASVSGTILAVCSCTVLPLFSGIYKRGAGLGPAVAFLYSGPAINVLAIILTARILGWQLGLARAVGAVAFSVIIGLLMHLIFLKEERSRQTNGNFNVGEISETRPLWQTILYFASMILFLVFANWGKPLENDHGAWSLIYQYKWWISGFSLISLAGMLFKWFKKDELKEWTGATWVFALQILPLLLGGVLVSGFLLGRVGHEGIIPSKFVVMLVGGNSLWANFFSSIVAAFMYFATLTEVPILQGLIGSGMGKGPALALLLAGPALSLPSMLVLRSVMGTKKTIVYVCLVVVMATISGMIFGFIVE
ncbi:MAG TPA: permease [Candidatus Omnitrophota bacterium]|nr:permease [Candidatus Omnitrophota bacterium]HPD84754.1 permease [Candidatus Omnitrophota bacterium]HRZ03612.1 permease [Candidatus Omnitrophota bacterium]